ncbi:tRNA glutamyl-Q(34) synthetase GluQRS [Phycisphaerales bacterium AB-hyl4]|uniref:tRNA glutamyl-Q(34) synthetase GluQRS n=1 Tax=Natronomicrosphaera hydrolytica TaxID=3242702 RepID=A0ABV4U6A9_9BACT
MGMAERRTTRLAPSPTGALHLGNARTFLINWAIARQRGWRVVLRIEDLDGPRVKTAADEQAIDVLQWLGLDWDEGPVWQRQEVDVYGAAMESLNDKGLLYPCQCTRREIEQAQSAPHADDHELRYPGTCRTSGSSESGVSSFEFGDAAQTTAWRLRVPDEEVAFVDQVHGEWRVNVQQQVGDFVVASKQGLPAYQLAVVVDDARQGVTDVVRGDDLLDATARQILLWRMLELGPPPCWWHVPLVIGEDGRRLAKRHGDTRVATYRELGVSADRVVGLIAKWSGVGEGEYEPMSARTFAERFKMERLPREAVTFTKADDAWLRDGAV